MANQIKKFEIVIGRAPEHKVSEFRGNLEQAMAHVAEQFEGASCVLRGYTTYQIRQGGRIIGSMQDMG